MYTIPEGHVVGSYRVGRRLARGGMGWIARGTHDALGFAVAIKLLEVQSATDEEIDRLLEEGRMAASVDSEHVVRILDAGAEGGVAFLVMEYVRGRTVEAEIRSRGRLSIWESSVIGAQVARGLVDVHDARVVHRDMKTDNIIVGASSSGDLRATLVDFGIAIKAQDARRCRPGEMVWGTPRFMSPEQARGGVVTTATDVYSLGVVLFAMVSGRVPFLDDDPAEVMLAHVRQRPPSVMELADHCPRSLADLIHRCLRKRPAARPSACEVAVQLDTMAAEAEVERRLPRHLSRNADACLSHPLDADASDVRRSA